MATPTGRLSRVSAVATGCLSEDPEFSGAVAATMREFKPLPDVCLVHAQCCPASPKKVPPVPKSVCVCEVAEHVEWNMCFTARSVRVRNNRFRLVFRYSLGARIFLRIWAHGFCSAKACCALQKVS